MPLEATGDGVALYQLSEPDTGALGGDIERRPRAIRPRDADPQPQIANLLSAPVLRLSDFALAPKRSAIWVCCAPSKSASATRQAQFHQIKPENLARAFSDQPLRPRAVPDVLQVVHRKSVGRSLHRDQRRMGRAADQGTLDHQSRRAHRSRNCRVASREIWDRKTPRRRLIEKFMYPKLGPGQLWEYVAEKVTAATAARSTPAGPSTKS